MRAKQGRTIVLEQQAKRSRAEVKSPEFQKVQLIAQEYEKALGIYRNRPALNWLKGFVKEGTRSYKQWLAAAEIADELGVDYMTYIQALFYFSDLWGKRPPKVWELSGRNSKFPAKDRVKAYLETVEKAEPIVGPTQPKPRVPFGLRKRRSEKQLNIFMNAYGLSQEDVFKKFAQGKEASLYFDPEWLKHNETYRKLKQQGELD